MSYSSELQQRCNELLTENAMSCCNKLPQRCNKLLIENATSYNKRRQQKQQAIVNVVTKCTNNATRGYEDSVDHIRKRPRCQDGRVFPCLEKQ